jgi:DNA-binding PadR family transcriptional regulator
MFVIKPKGGMMLIILDILRENELHGYAIAEKIEEYYGIEKPSSGLIYPLLSKLKGEGLVEVCKIGEREKKIYRITESGLKYLDERKEDVENAKSMLMKLGEFHKLGGHELIDSIHELIKNMDKLDVTSKEKLAVLLKDCARRIRFIVEFGDINE